MSELVKRGHDQVAELKSSCGAVDVRDVAQLISDLATQLDVQLARSNALTAENAALKSFGDKLSEMHNDLNGEGTGIQGRAEVACQQIALEAAMEEFDAIKTPATDAFLAEVRAQGVDALVERRLTAARLAKEAGHEITARDLEGEAIRARIFAMELRKGVQS
ncbi:hypothetical protein LCD41_16595 [Enterobacter roggenkampii]|nr:hypothetical protein [Enterobacter roggenkampii]UOZ13002.1 hypothetical protein LCD41_16595 [Enterobacter roggenkampii]